MIAERDTRTGSLADEQEIQAAIKLAEIVLPRGVLRDIAVSRMKYHAADQFGVDTALAIAEGIRELAQIIAGQESSETVKERFDKATAAVHGLKEYQAGVSFAVPEAARPQHAQAIVATTLQAAGVSVPRRWLVLRCEECGPELSIVFGGPDAELDVRDWLDEHTSATSHTVRMDTEYR
jgi:hypothetical protein